MNHLPELIELCRHPSIQSRRGEWRKGDQWACEHITIYEGYVDWDRDANKWTPHCVKSIWIPKLSDSIQPKRGLTDLLSERWELKQHMDGGFVLRTITGRVSTGPTPEIAVMKAVIAQEEEK